MDNIKRTPYQNGERDCKKGIQVPSIVNGEHSKYDAEYLAGYAHQYEVEVKAANDGRV